MDEHKESMTDMQRKCRAGANVTMVISPSNLDSNTTNLQEVTPESINIMRTVGGDERNSRCRVDIWRGVLQVTEAGKSRQRIIEKSARAQFPAIKLMACDDTSNTEMK